MLSPPGRVRHTAASRSVMQCMKTCNALPECERPVRQRGWCASHYKQWYDGKPFSPIRPYARGTPRTKMDRVEKWIGTGKVRKLSYAGYGQVAVDANVTGKVGFAHRLSWEAHRGPIPDGMVLDHLCRNRACVNPGHLEPVTNRQNILRGWAARRLESSERTHLSAYVRLVHDPGICT